MLLSKSMRFAIQDISLAIGGVKPRRAGRRQRPVAAARLVEASRVPAVLLIAQSRLAGADCARRLSALVGAPWTSWPFAWCRLPLPERRHGKEMALIGGNVTSGVVRVGDTVRRPRGDASPFTEQLLLHLEAVGFAGAPRWRGVDEQGRDTFSYLLGRVAALNEHLSDSQVATAGTLLRAFHDATRGSALADGQETVCHHDCGPHNMIFGNEDDLPYAMIDFDLAGPGDAIRDIGYSAWLCCINSVWLQTAPLADQARRLRLLTDSYGLPRRGRGQLLDALSSCQLDSVRWALQCLADAYETERVRQHAERILVACMREHLFLLDNRATFERALR